MAHELSFDPVKTGFRDTGPKPDTGNATQGSGGHGTQNAPLMQQLDALSAALHDPDWVAHCRHTIEGSHKIPAGTTYLAQLLSHDTSQTLNRIDVFEPAPQGANPSTINARGTPLLLSTLYGRGLHGDRHLFSEPWFRVGTGGLPDFLVRVNPGYDPITSAPLLADPRNGDTPILLFVASAFLHYHNAVVDRVRTSGTGLNNDQQFVLTRALVIRTWHHIIRSDILDRTCRTGACCQQTKQLTEKLHADPNVAVLAHSALRCFHSLVLQNYHFKTGPDTESIRDMLTSAAQGREIPSLDPVELANWTDIWRPDWPVFFDPAADHANLTGFTPSFVFQDDSVDIAKRDFIAAITHRMPDLASLNVPRERIERLYRTLDIVVPGPIKWADWGRKQPMPTMLGLLADGFFETEIDANGHPDQPVDLRLGPVASALVRCGIEKLIDAAEAQVAQTLDSAGIPDGPPPFELPGTFTKMIDFH
ncbi:hypothetical protein LCL97_02405 [Seohaeicola saemankumensis]|nr:peroxidase family protein [Seohaeicola saemankumensis]MCA0869667.1 hypothetical protein [Seohaeicola saemankumensis]